MLLPVGCLSPLHAKCYSMVFFQYLIVYELLLKMNMNWRPFTETKAYIPRHMPMADPRSRYMWKAQGWPIVWPDECSPSHPRQCLPVPPDLWSLSWWCLCPQSSGWVVYSSDIKKGQCVRHKQELQQFCLGVHFQQEFIFNIEIIRKGQALTSCKAAKYL